MSTTDYNQLLDRWNHAIGRWAAAQDLCTLLAGGDRQAVAIARAYRAELSDACTVAEQAYFSALRGEGKAANA